ncbi:MAG: hypothetical protein CMK96_05500 [Pseudomonas sp.]|nr:hypothetical protein [Pseudomonas sp.]QDP67250.1 MAG: hypothetical protein GOVbin7368_41 [Prokaryotic dsDNA virus sp.]|tara:strand:+ start:18103 stop:18372 length:270 start_codon:yes stop_codon:yes gene_type:complete
MLLRVKHKGHVHGGKRLAVGDTFPGSERLLKAMPDRFEKVAEEAATETKADPLDDLRAEAEAKGVKVDKRWGEERLREEIANADAANSK